MDAVGAATCCVAIGSGCVAIGSGDDTSGRVSVQPQSWRAPVLSERGLLHPRQQLPRAPRKVVGLAEPPAERGSDRQMVLLEAQDRAAKRRPEHPRRVDFRAAGVSWCLSRSRCGSGRGLPGEHSRLPPAFVGRVCAGATLRPDEVVPGGRVQAVAVPAPLSTWAAFAG